MTRLLTLRLAGGGGGCGTEVCPDTGDRPVMGMELEPLLRLFRPLKKLEKDRCSCMLENLSTSWNIGKLFMLQVTFDPIK